MPPDIQGNTEPNPTPEPNVDPATDPAIDQGTETDPPQSFYESFSDESLRGNPNVTKHASAEALAKSYIELSKKLGESGKGAPPADATPEQLAAYRAIKRGENIKSADDYSWKLKDTEKEALKGFDPSPFAKALFEAGADDETYSSVMGEIVKAQRSSVEQFKAQQEKALLDAKTQLEDEWGEDYAVNVKANEIFLKKFPEAKEVFDDLNLSKIPAISKMLNSLNKLTADGEIRIQKATQKSFDEQLSAIEKSDAYTSPWHEGHNNAVRTRADLIAKMAERK